MLITAIGAHIIRMVPPLIVSEEECDKAYEIIKETVERSDADETFCCNSWM